jgi:hypothetical protein
MKKLVIFSLVLTIILSCVFTCEAKKEFFNFVEIEKTLKNYFSYLESEDKENLLTVVGGDYYEFIKTGKYDKELNDIKNLGKIINIKFGEVYPGKSGIWIKYIVFIEYGGFFTVNEIIIEETEKSIKILEHSLWMITPRNNK